MDRSTTAKSLITDHNQQTISSTTYRACCCCLELVCRKSLWTEYVWMGETEVYGVMLKQCFDLNWPRNNYLKYQICEVCITRLRNAMQFKQKVVQCQQTLMEKYNSLLFEPAKGNALQSETVPRQADNHEAVNGSDGISDNGVECHNIEYDDDMYDGPSMKSESIKQDEETAEVKEKRLPVRNKSKRKATTRKKNTRKTVPKKREKKVDRRKLNYIKPRQNLSLILEHSTVLPFKSNKGYFNCFYCSKQYVTFTELKKHVGENHENMSFKSILKSILRPHDRIRADISNITCRICKNKCNNLEFLVRHLISEHNIKFLDEVKPEKCILGYDLGDGKFKCDICQMEFLFFKTLSEHMNSHSTDYVCPVCGRCFLLPERLRAHVLKHNNEKISAKCDDCGKICASSLHLKSHIRYTHKKLSFMCSICSETFSSYRQRMTHLEEIHNRAPLNLNCKVCSKKFFTPNSFNKHMRSEHFKAPKEVRLGKHGCQICGMLFKSKSALSYHLIVHSGEKNHECEFCHKKYARSKTLREHLKIHLNDRRWSCGACSQTFVQKCSLKNHVRVHHVDMNFEELIVYKKPDGK